MAPLRTEDRREIGESSKKAGASGHQLSINSSKRDITCALCGVSSGKSSVICIVSAVYGKVRLSYTHFPPSSATHGDGFMTPIAVLGDVFVHVAHPSALKRS